MVSPALYWGQGGFCYSLFTKRQLRLGVCVTCPLANGWEGHKNRTGRGCLAVCCLVLLEIIAQFLEQERIRWASPAPTS